MRFIKYLTPSTDHSDAVYSPGVVGTDRDLDPNLRKFEESSNERNAMTPLREQKGSVGLGVDARLSDILHLNFKGLRITPTVGIEPAGNIPIHTFTFDDKNAP